MVSFVLVDLFGEFYGTGLPTLVEELALVWLLIDITDYSILSGVVIIVELDSFPLIAIMNWLYFKEIF